MYERLTERAREVVVLAKDEARSREAKAITSHDLLLGLLREEHGLAARTLAALDVDLAWARSFSPVEEDGHNVEDPGEGQMAFTSPAKRVLELSLREALSLGHNYIGTEHVLLAIVRDNRCAAWRFLNDVKGISADDVRNEIIRLLSPAKAPGKPKIILGRKMIEALTEAGVVPERCSHVIVEAKYDAPVRVYYTIYGDERLLEVVVPAATAASVREVE